MQIHTNMFWFDADRITPVKFYPYTSLVTNTIFWLRDETYSKIPEEIKRIFEKVKNKALKSDKIQWDNKVVLECKVENFPHHIFMGYKDGALALGFGVIHDKWLTPIEF